ncbi:HAMP domain-containing sensor histidine kinase [Paenibacillus motobuensis]|uniref:histidine kinase n=1 Tax=Paenibacillus motobuensis TaxID=295324 RepID=A0ABN0Y4G2_9BACL
MRPKSKLFGMLVRNYIFFSLTVGLTVFLLLVWFIVQTNHYSVEHTPAQQLANSAAGTQEELRLFWSTMLEMGLIFVVLFGANVYVYSRLTAVRITNPLSAIASGIRSVAGGRYHERLSLEANYELAQIQESFNEMASKLEKAEADKKRLEESRQRMLVNLSHDVRTPITSIQGYAKALQLGMIEDEAHEQRILSLIYTKSQLVSELIDEVFELSKLESPDYPIIMKEQDLTEFLREIAVEFYELYEEKQLSFDCSIPQGEIIVPFNKSLLYRAVSNLLGNSLKYNPAGTRVGLKLADSGEKVQIEVTDNGVGISEPLRDKIFGAFVRGDAARKSDGGTGLGLTIARHIAEKHDGRLTLETGDGEWITRFELTLPKKVT